MPYNNSKYSEVKDALVKSVYNQEYEESKPSPPPGEYYLIDDTTDFLLDDTGDYLVTS